MVTAAIQSTVAFRFKPRISDFNPVIRFINRYAKIVLPGIEDPKPVVRPINRNEKKRPPRDAEKSHPGLRPRDPPTAANMSTAELFRPLWAIPPRVFAGHFHKGNHDCGIASKTAQRNLPVHDNGDPKAVVIFHAEVFSQRDPISLTSGPAVYGTRPDDTSRFAHGEYTRPCGCRTRTLRDALREMVLLS
jgi:hypothetical protein